MIIVLRDGAVVEQGTHDELIQIGGLYATMWHEQSSDTSGTEEIASLEKEIQSLRSEREEAILAEAVESKNPKHGVSQ